MFWSLSLPAWAQDFYVVAAGRKLKNVVTVAKSGGQYTDVKAAIDSINDAGADNPYLVYIGPGIYAVTSPIQLKAHVTVTGSGREATLLRGAISTEDKSSSAVILGADNAVLTQLGVENTGGSENSIGIYNSEDSPVLENIAVNASGGTTIHGVCNYHSSPTMTNVTVTGSGSGGTFFNAGVYNIQSSSPTMTNVTVTASGGTNNYGIYNESSSPTMINVTVTGSGGDYSFGVLSFSSSALIRNCTLKGSSYSIYCYPPSSLIIHNSLIDGSIGGSGDIYIANSRLNGGMEGSLTYHCIGNYGTTFQPVNCP